MEEQNLDIQKILGMAKRRVYSIILPFLIVLLGGMAFVLRADRVYQAETLILVEPQKVPESLVQPIVQQEIEDQLRTITQQVTSRTNLESIIQEYGLYAGTDLRLESKVRQCRESIGVDVGNTGSRGRSTSSVTFGISFRHTNPETARDVTNALASKFISENLRTRESQALGTSDFLSDEVESVRRRLEKKEEALKEFRMQNMGAMPDQLDTNLSMLERMQSQLEQLNDSLMAAQSRKLAIQEQIAQQERIAEQAASFSGAGLGEPGKNEPMSPEMQLAVLQKELEDLQMRYTENHPDVRRLQRRVEKLEAQMEQGAVEEGEADQAGEASNAESARPIRSVAGRFSSPGDLLRPQLEQINYEIRTTQAEIARTKERIDLYQRRVEETPRIEQQALTLKRDYDNLRDLYDSLLDRKLEAEIAVSMEKKQKGEQFRILDPAKTPEIPVEPDVRRILLLTLAIALGLGGGVGYLREMTDRSYKAPQEAREHLGLPILISLPYVFTEMEKRSQKRRAWLKATGVAAGFAIAAAGILLTSEGLDKTAAMVKALF